MSPGECRGGVCRQVSQDRGRDLEAVHVAVVAVVGVLRADSHTAKVGL